MERIIDIDLSAPLTEFKRKILLRKAFRRNRLVIKWMQNNNSSTWNTWKKYLLEFPYILFKIGKSAPASAWQFAAQTAVMAMSTMPFNAFPSTVPNPENALFWKKLSTKKVLFSELDEWPHRERKKYIHLYIHVQIVKSFTQGAGLPK